MPIKGKMKIIRIIHNRDLYQFSKLYSKYIESFIMATFLARFSLDLGLFRRAFKKLKVIFEIKKLLLNMFG